MDAKGTQLSNPYSTGGGGNNFETEVQTAFVVLMLTGGVAPCVPSWPIVKIKLQGKNASFQTDDFIAFVENRQSKQGAKLLAQIKHSLSITESDIVFGQVVQAAWLDFQNPAIFDKDSDALALITGPLSRYDVENARTILWWARHTDSPQEFFDNVNLGNFSSETKKTKLRAFRFHLKNANGNQDVDDDRTWAFLRCFHLLGYDLDFKSGVTLSILESHLQQVSDYEVKGLWALVKREVAFANQDAGTITYDSFSPEIRAHFKRRIDQPEVFVEPSAQVAPAQPMNSQNLLDAAQENAVVPALLIGEWDENTTGDLESIDKLISDNE